MKQTTTILLLKHTQRLKSQIKQNQAIMELILVLAIGAIVGLPGAADDTCTICNMHDNSCSTVSFVPSPFLSAPGEDWGKTGSPAFCGYAGGDALVMERAVPVTTVAKPIADPVADPVADPALLLGSVPPVVARAADWAPCPGITGLCPSCDCTFNGCVTISQIAGAAPNIDGCKRIVCSSFPQAAGF
ncbi:hypothetical protein K432DRAFT_427713 [Lepidopterella palustris CBS 459.81]|uniref:Uncharacterized protein n=1 Tax=Lepidopterella palustris CBS 459.81 TaxID=1314670 RepID=A0A8E2E5R8_9PEZI|nr:hypothetical protein K432DRAFT_427713 [Lepidopterella palustris CBS 459.81]